MDLHDFRYRHELDRRLFSLYADPTADDEWVTLPRDVEAARALLGTVSQLTGHSVFARVARSALVAHERYVRPETMSSYALCRDTALREAFGDEWDAAYLGWAAIVLEAVRLQMGDTAFGAFLRCVVEAEETWAAKAADSAKACV